MTSLSLLVVTIGRDTLAGMLESLTPQLQEQDYLTIVSDGRNDAVPVICEQFRPRLKAQMTIFEHPVNLGYWGHPIRNIYQKKLPGDFILHCDDDDAYIPGAIDVIRNKCTNKGRLYVFRMFFDYNDMSYVWRERKIRVGNVGTPQGIIPNNPAVMGEWRHEFGGDGHFYMDTECRLGSERIEFLDDFIYCQ